MRSLAAVAFLFLSLSLSAQNVVDLVSTIAPNAQRVDPGKTTTFVTRVDNFSVTSARDLRIEFAAQLGTIERIEAPSFWSCSTSGSRGFCSAPRLDEDCRCSRDIRVTVRANGIREGGSGLLSMRVSNDVTDAYSDNNNANGVVEIYEWITVTNTSDAGEGSLRWAIEQTDHTCAGPCKIAFEIPAPVPQEGWFTIVPETPLPPITFKDVALDAATQTEFSGDTNTRGPEVAIDGRRAHRGLEIHSVCEAIVRGLAIGHFDENQGLWFASNAQCFDTRWSGPRRLVENSHIGVDPAGNPWPNLRGMRLDGAVGAIVRDNVISHNTASGVWQWHGWSQFTRNVFDGNGASGILVGPDATVDIHENTFSNQVHAGVTIIRGNSLADIRRNSMRDNLGLPIDWGIDGVSPVEDDDSLIGETNAPVLLSAHYDAAQDVTIVSGRLVSSRIGPYGNAFHVELFANRGPDGDGERFLGSGAFGLQMFNSFDVSVRGDWRGSWITATVTRQHHIFAKPGQPRTEITTEDASTSEMSNAVLVP
ncbi:MAG TPA: right-handed parallel beta-helix repeat-containing protein [Thermoanaerobaculia bacterium]|nr:right-handed parallel beta-helix repeat-containing protein [Thermoanaerobaculia bacterium]